MKTVLILFNFLLLFVNLSYASQTTLLIARHGETDWNRQHLVQGASNRPLNETGKAQAKSLAAKLKGVYPEVAAIYSSDLLRAYETALPCAEKYGLLVRCSSDLQERDFGLAEGMKIIDVKARYGKAAHELDRLYPLREERWNYVAVPGAETLNHVKQRMWKKLVEICEQHPDQTVAIFSHGRAMKVFLATVSRCEMSAFLIPNCAFVRVDFDSSQSAPFSIVPVSATYEPIRK
ncbi:MAG: histidine phosphatase family protein [Chlamydiota bacterium]